MPPALCVRFWGVRGSVPAPGPRTARYGGNTPCVEIRAANGAPGSVPLVLDAGTGIRALGLQLAAEARAAGRGVDVTVCLTHAHWDHLQGLPFFAPLWDTGTRITALTAPGLRDRVAGALGDQMRPPFFPVAWNDVPATATVDALPAHGVPVEHGGLAVAAIPTRHPGGACGFRVAPAAGGEAVVYLPDNEIAESAGDPEWRAALVAAVRGAALLIHDATYVPAELPGREGWGHSSWDETVRLAVEAGVRRLALFHHHAERTDDAIDDLLGRARVLAPGRGVAVLAASEGLVLHV